MFIIAVAVDGNDDGDDEYDHHNDDNIDDGNDDVKSWHRQFITKFYYYRLSFTATSNFIFGVNIGPVHLCRYTAKMEYWTMCF